MQILYAVLKVCRFPVRNFEHLVHFLALESFRSVVMLRHLESLVSVSSLYCRWIYGGFMDKLSSLKQACWTHSLRTTCCLQHCHVVSGDIWNEKTFFNPFPGKAEIEHRSNFETLWAVIYGNIHYISNSFCKNMQNVAVPKHRLWIAFLNNFFLSYVAVYFLLCMR
jgi:hypothetical protein